MERSRPGVRCPRRAPHRPRCGGPGDGDDGGSGRLTSSVSALAAAVLDDPAAGVAVGTFGAIAEFARTGPATVTHALGVHVATTAEGGVRIDDVEGLVARAWRRPTGAGASWSHAVALCLPAADAAGPGRDVVTLLGPDDGALHERDRAATLVDLGLGVAHLEACVRTDDPVLLDALRAAAGRPLDAGLTAALVAAGPARVFRTAAARVEVATPIPPPAGTSPPGPHTHLLPALLAHRRTHAATDPIPAAHVPVASLFPAHPGHDLLGRPHGYDAGADAAFDAILARHGEPAEVAADRAVRDAIRRGDPARTPAPDAGRAGRRGWEVALRRLEAAGETGPVWAAWRAADARPEGSPGDDDAPFHEAHR